MTSSVQTPVASPAVLQCPFPHTSQPTTTLRYLSPLMQERRRAAGHPHLPPLGPPAQDGAQPAGACFLLCASASNVGGLVAVLLPSKCRGQEHMSVLTLGRLYCPTGAGCRHAGHPRAAQALQPR